jgi:hypothetical protein
MVEVLAALVRQLLADGLGILVARDVVAAEAAAEAEQLSPTCTSCCSSGTPST